jgi:murein DD-endopeptidase MepM/ murein hydrolase activator NlpD
MPRTTVLPRQCEASSFHQRVYNRSLHKAGAGFMANRPVPAVNRDLAQKALQAPSYRWPLNGPIRVTTEFRSRTGAHSGPSHPLGHGGLDLAARAGTSVLASADGKVIRSGRATGYGHWVVLEHSDGHSTIYGHLSGNGLAPVGTRVIQGDVIGRVGTRTEGHSTGEHLHFQVNATGVGASGAISPRSVLPSVPDHNKMTGQKKGDFPSLPVG